MSSSHPHTDVIGSLLRPSFLLEARQARGEDRLTAAEYKRIEDRAVDYAIGLQEGCGLDVVTDGEMRRIWFTGTLTEAIEGVEEVTDDERSTTWRSESDEAKLTSPHAITGRMRQVRSLATEEFAYARARARKPVKVTLPSPMMLLEYWSDKHSTGAYKDVWEAFADGAEILRNEARLLVELGCVYIQFDAPEIATTVDDKGTAFYTSQGAPPERIRTEGMDLLNGIADIPGAKFSLHMCRGNWNGMWLSEGGYEALSKEVFRRATNFDVICLEYDDHRSGSFEPLRDVPDDKTVVLGLVSTKKNALEPEDELIARIEEAATFFPKEQLALSTQCGFAPVSDDKPIDESAMERKLTTIATVARRVWGD